MASKGRRGPGVGMLALVWVWYQIPEFGGDLTKFDRFCWKGQTFSNDALRDFTCKRALSWKVELWKSGKDAARRLKLGTLVTLYNDITVLLFQPNRPYHHRKKGRFYCTDATRVRVSRFCSFCGITNPTTLLERSELIQYSLWIWWPSDDPKLLSWPLNPDQRSTSNENSNHLHILNLMVQLIYDDILNLNKFVS